MTPFNHVNCNILLRGDGDKVQDIAACATQNGFVTYWMPSEEERAVIAAGGHVRLVTMGRQFAPAWVDTEDN